MSLTAPAQLDDRTRTGRHAGPALDHDRPGTTGDLIELRDLVLMELFGYPREKAHALMLDVHEKGKAVVSNGTREQMEHERGQAARPRLWATVQQD